MPAVTPLHPGPARYEGGLAEVGPGVHAWLQPNGLLGESNASLVIGDRASLLVDTLWDPRLTHRMLTAMAPLIRDAPIETLVNTHSDGDHWWGNQEVRGAEIVATKAAMSIMEDETPAEMKRFGTLAGALRLAGSLPFPYPRRGDVGVIAAYAREALAPFEFDEIAGTMLVKEFGQGPQQGPQYLTAVGGTLYLGANGGSEATARRPGRCWSRNFQGWRPVAATPAGSPTWQALFLTAIDGTHYGLWRSDGTETGTTLVKEAVGAIDRATVGRTLYFATLDYGDSWLWRTDGTEAGTIPITSVGATPEGDGLWPQLTNVGGTLFFVRLGELARTDSTPGGTRDLRSGILPRQLTAVGKTLYFEGFDTKHGNELWQSDGTPRGTRLVRDIRRGERSSRLGELTAVGKTLFFSANDGRHGTELWRAGPRPCKKAKAKCKKG